MSEGGNDITGKKEATTFVPLTTLPVSSFLLTSAKLSVIRNILDLHPSRCCSINHLGVSLEIFVAKCIAVDTLAFHQSHRHQYNEEKSAHFYQWFPAFSIHAPFRWTTLLHQHYSTYICICYLGVHSGLFSLMFKLLCSVNKNFS